LKVVKTFCQDQDQDQNQDYFLSSRRLETKTLVSRTTPLITTNHQGSKSNPNPYTNSTTKQCAIVSI